MSVSRWACSLPLLVVCCLAAVQEGGECVGDDVQDDGRCVCRLKEDCLTVLQPSAMSARCCAQGLICCPNTGVSKRKCEEYSALAGLQFGDGVCRALAMPLITGGDLAEPGQVPHMALLGYGDTLVEAAWMCGGSLVSERWVLTAGHCVHGHRGPVRWVRLGVWLEGDDEVDDAAQELSVQMRVVHPRYRPPARYNDIGLLRLGSRPTLGPSVRPACLQEGYAIPTTRAQACGYGRVAMDADNAGDVLRCVSLLLVPRVDCARSYKEDIGRSHLPHGLPRSVLCAGDLDGGRDTCQGDSGGPLHMLAGTPYCSYVLLGVTSFGKFCGLPDSPGVYMRVSHYLSWIESVVWAREVQASRGESVDPTDPADAWDVGTGAEGEPYDVAPWWPTNELRSGAAGRAAEHAQPDNASEILHEQG